MGDRALVVFVSSNVDRKGKTTFTVSPTAYLHCEGSEVPALLEELKTLMAGRRNDKSYALARFIGICHSQNPDSNLSLGCFETPSYVRKAITAIYSGKDVSTIKTPVYDWTLPKPKTVMKDLYPANVIAEHSHGDAGVVVVDTRDFSWKAYGGYLQDSQNPLVDEDK